MSSAPNHQRLACGQRYLDFSCPQVMGILNVTPDSFSDGGRFMAIDSALRHAESMVLAGASLVDVGGESTRPGAAQVSEAQELDRVAPVIEAVAAELDVIISVGYRISSLKATKFRQWATSVLKNYIQNNY